jgi:hypothetical protein
MIEEKSIEGPLCRFKIHCYVTGYLFPVAGSCARQLAPGNLYPVTLNCIAIAC